MVFTRNILLILDDWGQESCYETCDKPRAPLLENLLNRSGLLLSDERLFASLITQWLVLDNQSTCHRHRELLTRELLTRELLTRESLVKARERLSLRTFQTFEEVCQASWMVQSAKRKLLTVARVLNQHPFLNLPSRNQSAFQNLKQGNTCQAEDFSVKTLTNISVFLELSFLLEIRLTFQISPLLKCYPISVRNVTHSRYIVEIHRILGTEIVISFGLSRALWSRVYGLKSTM